MKIQILKSANLIKFITVVKTPAAIDRFFPGFDGLLFLLQEKRSTKPSKSLKEGSRG
jgi:hypothetical protein